MIPYLLILAKSTLLPGAWLVFGSTMPLPGDLNPTSAGYCRVDASGKYFYTRNAQVSLATGRSKQYAVELSFRAADHLQEFRLEWADDRSRGWEETGFADLYYARDDVLGGRIEQSSINGLRRAGTVMSILGGPPTPYDEKFDTLLKPDLSWKVPYPGLNNSSDYAKGAPAFIHGTTPDRYPLPREFYLAQPVVNGVIWEKKMAYLLMSLTPGAVNTLYSVDFHGKKPAARKLPRMPSDILAVANGSPQNALVDGSICDTRDAFSPATRPKRMKHRYATLIYTPSEHKWKLYDGLLVWGSSHDGRFVAFSLPPWSSFQVAKVGLVPLTRKLQNISTYTYKRERRIFLLGAARRR